MLDDPYAMVPLPKVREMVRRARAEAAAEEREACARLVQDAGESQLEYSRTRETEADRSIHLYAGQILAAPRNGLADAIRARGGPTP